MIDEAPSEEPAEKSAFDTDDEEEEEIKIDEPAVISRLRQAAERLSPDDLSTLNDTFKELIQKKMAEREAQAPKKPEKCDKGHSMNQTTNAKPRECSNGDFNMGEDINCQVCKLKITLSEGYFTCMDACDFDVHK